jgi:cellulose synthase/poly-beta-1,6-N-acetylglucosamine synthase-like glycosyltransferase
MNPFVSIIIPCKEIDDYVRKCIKFCRKLDYESYEIVVLPDNVSEMVIGEVRVIATGPVTPGAKRNIGILNSKGEICAFIDSDAYPRRDWLRRAVRYFSDPRVAAVGGPGLTPMEDGVMQKASGYVLSSFMVGQLSSRYKAKGHFESDDLHSCNFVARKSVLIEAGCWNEKYWPGEDTLICLAIKRLGKRLVEASDVIVYHHRRSLFREHLRQVWRFGLHRGFFIKRFQGNSFKFLYVVPSLFILSLFAGVFISVLNSFVLNVLLLASAIYFILCFVAAVMEVRKVKLILPVWLGIMATHMTYGFSFLIGLLKRDLKR